MTKNDQQDLAKKGQYYWTHPRDQHWGCIDGRHDTPTYGTPGGDMGEFLLVQSVLKRHITRQFTPQEYGEMLYAYIDSRTFQDPFYMHTDEHSVELAKQVAHPSPTFFVTRLN
jgi:hypothetical protein